MASKVKVEYRVSTIGIKAGEIREVDKDIAENLITNGHAIGISEAAKKLEAEITGTAPSR